MSQQQPTLSDLPFMERWLVAPKILNLILNISSYTSQVFFIFYCTNTLGMSKDDYGLFVNLTYSLACFVGVNIWTYFADRFKAHRSVLVLASLFYTIFFSMTFFKPFHKDQRALMIAYVSLFYGLQNACCSAMYPLLDNQVMTILSKHPLFSKELYGRQRLWGTVGHAVSSIAVGTFVSEETHYVGMFICNIVSTAAFIIAVLLLIPKDVKSSMDSSEQKETEEPKLPCISDSDSATSRITLDSASRLKVAPSTLPSPITAQKNATPPYLTLLRDPNFLFFLFVIFVTGVAKHVLSIFSSLFVNKRFKLSEGKVGLSQACAVVPEILLFYFGKQINNKIGLHWMLIIAQFATIIRVLSFSWIPASQTWSAYVIESFKGVSTSLLIMSGVRLAHELAPTGLEATAQGAFVAVFQGLATAVSGIANYFVSSLKHLQNEDETEKMIVLFKYTGYVSLLAVVLLAMKWAFVDKILCARRKP